jgi:hypothetical protein
MSNIKLVITNVTDQLQIPYKWKFIGSLSKSDFKSNEYIKDIDISIYIERIDWQDVLNIIDRSKHIHNLQLTYLTFTNNMFDFDLKITSKNDFSQINFDSILRKIKNMKDNDIISTDTFNTWNSYVMKPTFKNLLFFQKDIASKNKIKLNLDDIKKPINIYGVTYDIVDLYKKSIFDDKIIIHFNFFYDNNLFLIDLGMMTQDNMATFAKRKGMEKNTVSTSMYLDYYSNNWVDMFGQLKYITHNFKLHQYETEIRGILKDDLGIHKALLFKLKKITEFIKHKHKYSNINVDELMTVYNNMKPLMIQIGYDNKYDTPAETYYDFNKWMNKKIIPFYNQWRELLVKERPQIDDLIPPEILKN